MKPYLKYKDSGVESIGKIPFEWSLSKFGRISYMKGRIGWQGLKSSEFTEKGPYLITGMNFKDGKIRWEEVYHITEERYNEAPEIQLEEKDVLMTKDGTIGKLLYVDHLPDRASLNSHLLVFRPLNNEYISKYLYYQLQSPPFKHHIELHKTGTTFYGITQSAVSLYKMLIPPLSEQTTIANFLDHKTAQIDQSIEKQRALIVLLREHRAAIINEAVTKGIDPDVPMKDSGVEWIGEIPAHWLHSKLKLYCDKITDGSHFSPASQDEGFPYVSVKDVGQNVIDTINCKKISKEDFDKLEKNGCRPIQGDILLTKDGTIGRAAIVEKNDFVILSSLGLIRPNKKFDNRFLRFYLISELNVDQMLSYIHGSALKRLTIVLIKNLTVIIPPLQEQQQIVQYIETETTRIDQEIDTAQKEIELLEEYRQALIAEAVTGKIDVRDYVLEE